MTLNAPLQKELTEEGNFVADNKNHQHSDRPSYLPDVCDSESIPDSLKNETYYWTTGRGQVLSEESALALLESEAIMTGLYQSDALKNMNLDVTLHGSQSIKRHCTRVAVLSLLINDNLKRFNPTSCMKVVADSRILAMAAMLHDIGKLDPEINRVTMSKEKYQKKASEWEIIKRHPVIGSELAVTMPGFESQTERLRVAEAVYQHHERFDGSGYHHTTGNKITREAAILAVADTVDAMGEPRSYKGPIPTRRVMSELDRCHTQFHPKILHIMRRMRSVSGIFVKHRNSNRP